MEGGGLVRILHTSDLHLAEKEPKTIRALEVLLGVASENSVDILTIAGDIFDSAKDADKLRPEIRSMFRGLDYDVIVIPGNHDGSILSKQYDWGFDVIAEDPFGIRKRGKAAIVGVPYKERADERLLLDLREVQKTASPRVLLLHCTLDWGYSDESYGNEDRRLYFPISREALSALQYDYVLAGHFHSSTEVINLRDKGVFVYPGSPVSHTRRELGKRYAVLIDTEMESADRIPLDTTYFDQLLLKVVPGEEEKTVKQIQEWYTERADDQSSLKVIVQGVIAIEETEFEQLILEVAPQIELANQVRDIQSVLSHPLYSRFKEELRELDDTEPKDDIDRIVLEIMSNLIGAGEL
ncbi:DNA repair exonuclease [Candidatus Thorarchaeota archaeon]|nr:MAG: DNA repair exonuclease [Candidatus Thorarchaeota archaeon]